MLDTSAFFVSLYGRDQNNEYNRRQRTNCRTGRRYERPAGRNAGDRIPRRTGVSGRNSRCANAQTLRTAAGQPQLITNAINLIDGIDGLASGLTGSALLVLGSLFLINGMWIYALLSFATLGVLVPFFYYNVFGQADHGRKIFMGDTGSLTLGIYSGIPRHPLFILQSGCCTLFSRCHRGRLLDTDRTDVRCCSRNDRTGTQPSVTIQTGP